MIKRFLAGLFLGLFGTLLIVQHDPWVHRKITKWLACELARSFDCEVSLTIIGCDILFPTLVLSNLSMRAHDDSWNWHAERYATGFSWIRFATTGMLDLWASVKKIDAATNVDEGNVAILPHLVRLMKGPDLPVPACVSYIDFKQGFITLTEGALETNFWWDCIWQQEGDKKVKATITCADGNVSYNGEQYLNRIKGNLALEKIRRNEQPIYRMRIDSKGNLLHLGKYKTCVLSGNWHDGNGRFQLQSADQSLRMSPLILKEKKDGLYVDGTASIPLSLLYRLLYINEQDCPIKGICAVKLNGFLGEHGSLDGHLICDEVKHPWCDDPIQLTATFTKRKMDWRAQWAAESGISHGWHGAIAWQGNEQKGTTFLSNDRAFTIPYTKSWCIPEGTAVVRGSYDAIARTFQTSYECTVQSPQGETFSLNGVSRSDRNLNIEANGELGTYQYHLAADCGAKRLKTLQLKDPFNKERLILSAEQPDSYKGSIDYSIIQKMCTVFLNYETQGEGVLTVQMHNKGDIFETDFSLDNGTIRLPQTYNFMSGLNGTIRFNQCEKKITIADVTCSLHTGSLWCPEGVIWFDSESGTIPFAHVPLFINRCLVTAKQDLFAMVSGDIIVTKKNAQPPHVAGHLILNRAQLKENLFSGQVQKKLLQAASSIQGHKEQMPFTCDLTLATKDPIRVDTNFLQANAHLSLAIKGSRDHPMIEGTVSIPSGSLAFPYKPLSITKGAITFVKEQPFNPLVELTAKNSIKNHAIALNVHGSLQDHMVLLESTPPLSEEQIVGLLIAGAHEESLDVVIPALLMQNVTNFLFSSHKLNFFDHYIKPWMKQINVTLTPKFGDQSGRGGLRGALEITVNDRWRALIEKNFSLTEDTNFELEYILSDDITFRVLRDERRDIGGEVEMKFKF